MINEILQLRYQELFTKYPLSFRGHDSEDTQFMTGVHWPDEWFPLIDQTCSEIEKYLFTRKEEIDIGSLPRIFQIKEKHGELRINIRPRDEMLRSIIANAIKQSLSIRIQ
jgi:hypothetical protein